MTDASRPRTGKGRAPSTPMDAVHVLAVLDALGSRGISTWIHGGWGIDALLGVQTRPHDDIDLVVQRRDCTRAIAALGTIGFHLAQGRAPMNFVLLDAFGRQVDVHPVQFAPNGDGLYRTEQGDDWPFPAAGFAGRGRIGDRAVRCLTPEIEVLTHSGYELDDEDRADLAALRERFRAEISTA